MARRLLGGDCRMTDEEIATMLDQLRQIASMALGVVGNDHASPERPFETRRPQP